MRQYLLLIALCLHIAARGQTIASLDDIDLSGLPTATKAKALRYWIDDDTGSVRTVTQLSGKQIIDVSSQTVGLHTLHYQVIDENNAVASAKSAVLGSPAKEPRSLCLIPDWTETMSSLAAG